MDNSGAPALVGSSEELGLTPERACMECGGPLQWRCPACKTAQSAKVANLGRAELMSRDGGGWVFLRNDDQSITITNASGAGVVVHKGSIGPREIPEEVLYALAEALGA